MSQVTHQAGAYPGFCSMRATRSNSTPSWLRCLSFAGLPPALNSLVPIYTPGCMERGTVRAKCLAQEHNRMPQAKARTRSMRPLHLPKNLRRVLFQQVPVENDTTTLENFLNCFPVTCWTLNNIFHFRQHVSTCPCHVQRSFQFSLYAWLHYRIKPKINVNNLNIEVHWEQRLRASANSSWNRFLKN